MKAWRVWPKGWPEAVGIVPASGKSLIRAAKSIEEAREAMGIDWMTWEEIREAIPPAYTELIGAQLLDHLRHREAA